LQTLSERPVPTNSFTSVKNMNKGNGGDKKNIKPSSFCRRRQKQNGQEHLLVKKTPTSPDRHFLRALKNARLEADLNEVALLAMKGALSDYQQKLVKAEWKVRQMLEELEESKASSSSTSEKNTDGFHRRSEALSAVAQLDPDKVPATVNEAIANDEKEIFNLLEKEKDMKDCFEAAMAYEKAESKATLMVSQLKSKVTQLKSRRM